MNTNMDSENPDAPRATANSPGLPGTAKFRRGVLRGIAPLLVLLIPAFMAIPGRSLPLFARKYNMQCTACHVAFPRLNKFGMQFRQNGYRLQGQPGTSPWEDKSFPLSIVGIVGYHYVSTSALPKEDAATLRHGNNKSLAAPERVRTNTSRFQQDAFELHSAGTLAEHITFHFDCNFDGQGGPLLGGMAFAQFDDIAQDGALNIKAGIFDAEIPYISSSRRLTQREYVFPFTFDGNGVELNGANSGWTYAAAVINSERTLGAPDSKTLNNFEDVYGWVMKDIGSNDVTARVVLKREDPRAADKNSSTHLLVDVSALLNISKAIVIPAFNYQKQSDVPVGMPEKTEGAMLEATVFLDEANLWVLTGRYELQHVPSTDALEGLDHTAATLNISRYLNPNAKVGVEWSRDAFSRIDQPRVDEVQAYVHIGY